MKSTRIRCITAFLVLAVSSVAGMFCNLEAFLFGVQGRIRPLSAALSVLVVLGWAGLAWFSGKSRVFPVCLSVYFGLSALLLGAAYLANSPMVMITCMVLPTFAVLLPLGGFMIAGAEWLLFVSIPIVYLLSLFLWLRAGKQARIPVKSAG